MTAMMKTLLFAAVCYTSLVGTIQAQEKTQYRDAREQIPEAFLGFWEADLEASTFSGNAPTRALRTFQLTEGGKVLVNFMNWNANGTMSMGHWAAQMDGTPGVEYHIRAGSIPYNTVNLTIKDDRNLDLSVKRHDVENLKASYTLSEDGTTLTYRYDDTTMIYRR